MEKIITIVLSVLLASCFSYKEVDFNQIELEKDNTYKILTKERRMKKGNFHARYDSLLVLKNKKGQLTRFEEEEIEEIRVKKFSLGKTIGLPVGITTMAIIFASDGVFNFGPAIDW